MINTRVVLCFFLVPFSALGMERAVKRLKLDVMIKRHQEAPKNETILFQWQEDESDHFTEEDIKRAMSCGVSIDAVNSAGDTVLCRAVAAHNKEQVKLLAKCGASLDYPLTCAVVRVIKTKYGYPGKMERALGRLWFHYQRKQALTAALLSLNRVAQLPPEMVRHILRYCVEMIPSCGLEYVCSGEQLEEIKTKRKRAVRELFSSHEYQ